jgi:bifunctional UDP-N-acetylglucosamine pyrophosphorylase/glucosamine-1-phosphate N-acetyltransferase
MVRPVYDVADLPRGPVAPSEWTAIIPAAGRGSRLGHDRPKVLYPVLGRPILDWVLDTLEGVCSRVVLVLSPQGQAAVEPVARARLADRLTVVIQPVPTGMGDAVRLAAAATQTVHSLVVWGDQVTLRAETVAVCAALHEARPQATLTLPTVLKRDPYIDFERDAEERIIRVRQAREGEIEREIGENDCGLFLFSTRALSAILEGAFAGARGVRTGESNLLQVLPRFEHGPGSVATVRISDIGETLGVNTPEDAAMVANILTARAQQ